MKKLYSHVLVTSLLMLASLSMTYAQRTITGTVIDETGTAIPGVNVLIKGTSSGTVTGMDGSYSISIATDEATLVFSFIGYHTKEAFVGNRAVINIALDAAIETLTELVVTGYASQEKKDITGSVASIKTSDLVSLPASNPEAQIQGRVAGVTVISSGVPGASSSVRIRGFSSFGGVNANGQPISQSSPLYVVDGVPTYDLTTFNSYDVESITVLKDAGAASIYGARASNGVVVITTKRGGAAGKMRVSYDMYYGLQDPGDGFTNLLNSQETADLMWLALGNDGKPQTSTQYGSGSTPVLPNYILPSGYSGDEGPGTPVDPALYNIDYNKGSLYQIVRANKSGTDWFKAVTHTAPIQTHNLSLGGGSPENAQYYVSLNYFNQQGIIRETYTKRFSLRANTQFNIKDRVRIGESAQISYRTNPTAPTDGPPQPAGTGFQNGREDNPIAMSYRMQPIVPVYDIMGNFAGSAGTDLGNAENPVANQIRNRDNTAFDLRVFGNIYAEVDLLDGLTGRTSFGGSLQNGFARFYTFHTYENSENTPTDNLKESAFTEASWVWTNTLNYKRTFGNHNIQGLAGIEAVKRDIGRDLSAQRFDYFSSDPDYVTINNGASGQVNSGEPRTPATLFSVFGRIDYGFHDKYLLSATVRRDGSSKFGAANKYGTFPSFTAAWRLGAEPFMASASWLTDLKIRAGWGTMGNENNVPSANQFTQYGGNIANAYYDLSGTNGSSQQGFIVTNLGVSSTKWETNETSNIGVDAAFLAGKVNVTLDLYQKVTKDLLFNPERPAVYGLLTYPFTNIGQMTNKGIDLAVDYREVAKKDWRYGVTGTFTLVRNTIDKISNDAEFFDYNSGEENRLGDRFVRNSVGHSLSAFYGYRVTGLFQSQDEVDNAPPQDGAAPGTFRYADVNGDGEITPDDRTFLGSPIPNFNYGLNINLGYRNFDFTLFLYGAQGAEIMNFTKWWTDFPSNFSGAKSQDALYHSWTPERPNATTPMASYVAGTISTGKASNSYYMEDGSYLRARNVQLSYTLSQDMLSRLGLEKARIYIQGVNLFTITDYSGLNPELGGNDAGFGIDFGSYPTPRQYLLGLNITL